MIIIGNIKYSVLFHQLIGCYLFIFLCCSVNVTAGIKEDRMMMTGLHTVSDIFCVGCGAIVGWKYVRIISSFLLG